MSVKSKIILPFEVKFKSDVNGGYADELHSNYVEDTEIVNYHKDQVEMESSMDVEFQSPFTNQWVGGRS